VADWAELMLTGQLVLAMVLSEIAVVKQELRAGSPISITTIAFSFGSTEAKTLCKSI
jgi:hypothetical protein